MRFVKEGLTVLMSMVFLTGCQQKEEAPVLTAEPVSTVLPTATPFVVRFDGIRQKTEEIARMVQSGQAIPVQGKEPVLPERTEGSFEAAFPVYDAERIAGYADFSDGTRLMIRYDNLLNVTDIAREARPQEPVIESGVRFEEQLVLIGKEPQLYGILTIPKGNDRAPVAVLFAGGMSDDLNRIGPDPTLRKELAHALAENGVATLRYDMRLFEDPLLLKDDSEKTLARILTEDAAAAIHVLDELPVDPKDISVIGIGESAAYAGALVYHHFETKGGLVLMGMPYHTGIDYFAVEKGLSKEDANGIREQLEEEVVPEMIHGLPSSFWQQADTYDFYRLQQYVQVPILLISGNEKQASDGYGTWHKILKDHRRYSTRVYPELTDTLRNSDWQLDETAVKDLAEWIKTGVLPKERKKK